MQKNTDYSNTPTKALDPDKKPNECLELNKWINTDECVKEYFSKLDRYPVIGDHRAANAWIHSSKDREARKALEEIAGMRNDNN